jgi:IMP dehydrogenase
MPHYVEQEGLTFADVLIIPAYSDIETRTSINVLSNYLGEGRVPIISAPMDYVTGYEMANEMYALGAYGVVNRFSKEAFPSSRGDYGIAVGIKDLDVTFERIGKEQPHSVCIDVAHGHHKNVSFTIREIKDAFPDIYIMAGNIATSDGFKFLAENGVDAVRVGIGPGSACSTRENTGVGVPQLTAIMRCADAKEAWGYYETALIADGGIQTPGDIVKALAAGADAVMLGQMLAGHKENPGHILGHPIQPYRGQSIFGSNAKRGAPEGVEGWVQAKGLVKDTIESLINYLRSGMSYVGANNVVELREKAQFMKISPGTFKESETRLV